MSVWFSRYFDGIVLYQVSIWVSNPKAIVVSTRDMTLLYVYILFGYVDSFLTSNTIDILCLVYLHFYGNKLIIEYQSYPKSTTVDVFGQ